MARYQYTGPGPDENSGELIRPLDIREFDEAPDWGPWELLPEPEEEPPATPEPAPPVPVTPFTGVTTITEGI